MPDLESIKTTLQKLIEEGRVDEALAFFESVSPELSEQEHADVEKWVAALPIASTSQNGKRGGTSRLREIILWLVVTVMFLWGVAIVVLGPLTGEVGGFSWGVVMLLVGGWGLWTMWRANRDARQLEEHLRKEL
jgi:hypothetical protein